MEAAQLFVKALESERVEYIFGIPGEENIDVMDALLDSPIKFVTCHHEQGAAFLPGDKGRAEPVLAFFRAWVALRDWRESPLRPRCKACICTCQAKPYPYPSLHAPIRTIYDTFGPQRMMWGSDVTRLDWGYEDNLRLFTDALEFLSESDREWILSKSAATQCGWPL